MEVKNYWLNTPRFTLKTIEKKTSLSNKIIRYIGEGYFMDFQTEKNEILTNEPPKQHKRLIAELEKKCNIKEEKPKGLFTKKKSK